MKKGKRIGLLICILLTVCIAGALAWLLFSIFEGDPPRLNVEPLPRYLTAKAVFQVTAQDADRGLRSLDAWMRQGERRISVLEKSFPFEGFFNNNGLHYFQANFTIDPSRLNLSQGEAILVVEARDWSKQNGGDGNRAHIEHPMQVDTIPPAVRPISRQNYVNVGGTGFVVYQTSSDSVESGVFVNGIFFPGFPAKKASGDGFHLCYFALPWDTASRPDIHLWSKDEAGNASKAEVPFHYRKKRFRNDRIAITDGFIGKVLPYFSEDLPISEPPTVEEFLQVNRRLRKENNDAFYSLRSETCPEQLWDGEAWLRLKNAAPMARFGDHRDYFYNGSMIDEQVHMGVDLASVAHAEVDAANNGRVLFAGRAGIYGLTVVLDHGQGVMSVYAHLSQIWVKPDQMVSKGEIIGLTGQTGLAGGDHLHFAAMVGGIFVNPIEWWDAHWIRDNITRKLELIEPQH